MIQSRILLLEVRRSPVHFGSGLKSNRALAYSSEEDQLSRAKQDLEQPFEIEGIGALDTEFTERGTIRLSSGGS